MGHHHLFQRPAFAVRFARASWWIPPTIGPTQPDPWTGFRSAQVRRGRMISQSGSLVHWALRREELCDPGLCPDAPEEDAQRCDHCPLDRLDAAQCAEKGLLIRRSLDLMSALKLAVHISLEEIRGDEFCAILIIAEERDLLEREKAPRWNGNRSA